jgi:hypothetical protein
MNAVESGRGLWDWKLVKVIIISSILFFGCNFLCLGFSEDAVRQCIAWSARIGVILFMLAFGAKVMQYFFRNSFSFWLMMNRPFLGISFAIIHLIHLIFLVLLQQVFHPVFTMADSFSLFAGGVAYFFLVLMLLTSFSFFKEKLSKLNWKRLHTFGGWWIWTIFMSSYWKRVFQGENGYIILAVLLVLVGIGRFWILWKRK